jgi:Xaa-Pro aminopeptidase
LAALRAELKRRGLAGFILPRGDEHQGEYVAPVSERLAWLTCFTGSAGLAIVLARRAAIFVDGRYTLQVRAQVDTRAFETLHLIENPPSDWFAKALRRGQRVGYDPWLHTPESVARFAAAAAQAGARLIALEGNPVDAVWKDRPASPIAPVVPHPEIYAGRSAAAKRVEIANRLRDDGFDGAVLSAPDSIAWLLNIRGGDVPHTPLALGFAIVHVDRSSRDAAIDLFIDPRKLAPGLAAHLGNRVRIQPPDMFARGLSALGQSRRRVAIDSLTAAAWIAQRLERAGAEVIRRADPCALLKACKNPRELDNARTAHLRDGVAVTRFLAWLADEGPRGELTEIDAGERLYQFRREGANFRDLSFSTIAGAGPNGAIVHYRVSPATNRRISPAMLLLVDSGAQYLEGTTDITRTVAIGSPSEEERDRFTRVLKGHIAIATARFPKGTTGSQIDALARRALWQVGLDYDHGTGHGVGSYLGVHEGPQRIAKAPNATALMPGMIVSNEPGYYKTGAYGIRIENLVAVRELPADGAERPLLEFETLTLAPIDRALIEPKLLSGDELAWLNSYHARVRDAIAPLVDSRTSEWLAGATKPIAT